MYKIESRKISALVEYTYQGGDRNKIDKICDVAESHKYCGENEVKKGDREWPGWCCHLEVTGEDLGR